jgi:hippurate hydrolase
MLAAGHLLIALQSIVARNVDPLDTAVVSIATINGGFASNQIPSTVRMTGTFRTHRPEVRDLIEGRIRAIAAGVAQTFDVGVAVEINHGVSVTRNHKPDADLAAAAAEAMGAAVRRDMAPSMAGEDFGWYLEERPGAFAWIGNGPASEGAGLHNPGYNYNDDILPIASGWLASTARRALQA